jgi:hypothetical protein
MTDPGFLPWTSCPASLYRLTAMNCGFGTTAVQNWAASSPWSSNHRHGAMFVVGDREGFRLWWGEL